MDQVQALAQKLAQLPAEIGSAAAQAQASTVTPALSAGFAEFITRIQPGRINRKNVMVVGAIQPDWLAKMPDKLRPRTAEIAVSELNVC